MVTIPYYKKAALWAVLFLAGFLLVAVLVTTQHTEFLDRELISLIQGQEGSFLTSLMKLFTFIGSAEAVVFISVISAAVFYRLWSHRPEGVLLVAAVGGAALLNLLLKSAFHRARPTLHKLIEQGGFSFPSGHAMSAFALYGILTYIIWRHVKTRSGRTWTLRVGVLMVLAIGVSRIYLGVHYPSDVLGGYLASGFWLSVCIRYFERHIQRTPKRL